MAGRFSKFGLVINPETEEKIDWLNLSKSEIYTKLKELKFQNKDSLQKKLLDLTIEGQPKRSKGSNEIEPERYNVKIVDYGGQLEQGAGGTPHWQLWVETKPQTTKRALLKALSRSLYGKDSSKAVSVLETGLTTDDLKKYCRKEGRLELEAEFDYNILDKTTQEFVEYLEENESLKKYMIARGLIKDTLFNL